MGNPPRESNDLARAAAATLPQIGDSIDTRRLRAVAIVPARISSRRLPRKMLLEAAGLPLFVHTARNAQRAKALDLVLVATDSSEVLQAAAAHGVAAASTLSTHQSGTDRVHEAFRALVEAGDTDFDVVVNVQGDEPTLDPDHIDYLVAAFAEPAVEFATLCAPLLDRDELMDPAVVKVVRDSAGDALYFSRAAIPSGKHTREKPPASSASPRQPLAFRHVGVYAFRPAALTRFCALPQGHLEVRENLEQLRWLEAGGKLRCLEVDRVAPGIDTRAQFEAFRTAIEATAEAESSSSSMQSNGGQA